MSDTNSNTKTEVQDPRGIGGVIAVPLRFALDYGPDPRALPIPGEGPRSGVKPPKFAGDGTRYMLDDGSVWEYLGIGSKADNRERVRGWFMIAGPLVATPPKR